ncbi:hypothetical protein U1Q18_020929 [Sarracenia purpurea var. burkii]
MKIVSGKVTSTKISLSKAAKILSNFEAAETGASQVVSTYLSRASFSFNDLVQFHKDLKASKSDCNIKKHAQEIAKIDDAAKHEQNLGGNEVDRNVEDSDGSRSARKKHRKKKKNGVVERCGEVDDRDIFVSEEQSSSKKKKKKKRKIEGED